MALKTSIEWTESTWNPVTGCSKISAGCAHCYAERMAKRLKAMGSPNYETGFEVALHPDSLELPLKWKKPQMIFVNSMSDLFHKKVPLSFIKKIFATMTKAEHHQFQILTKRSPRLVRLSDKLDWAENIMMGVTVENERCRYRIDDLRQTKAKTKFLSLEPLLEPLPKLNLKGIDWVIVGGESGPRSRSIKEEWVIDIKEQCIKKKVPFFFKQWGGFHKKKNGRLLENKTWDQLPEILKKLSAA
ncbi:MAG: phage Gp37/Gp68 family protein [candidate division Zixibacteria bacterium]|nr:phage Gp37/Gp68 family protein [candidate division Zixibacteria bacterium]